MTAATTSAAVAIARATQNRAAENALALRAIVPLRPARLANQVSRARHIAASVLLVRGQVRHLPGELLDLPLQGQNTAMARRHRP